MGEIISPDRHRQRHVRRTRGQRGHRLKRNAQPMDNVWLLPFHGAPDPAALYRGQQWPFYPPDPTDQPQAPRRCSCERPKPLP